VVADALNCCLQWVGICFVFHYLDNFILIATPQSEECDQAVPMLDSVCARIGVPKPSHTYLTVLGIKIDTVAGELHLPDKKLQRLKALLQEWGTRKMY